MHETEKKSRISIEEEALLREGYQANLELIEQMEQLSQFQDKIETPYETGQIWKVFLNEVQALIKVDTCALFLVDEKTHEFVLFNAFPQDTGSLCRKEVELQIESGMFSSIIFRRQPALTQPLGLNDGKTLIILPLCTVKRTTGVVMVYSPIKESSITQQIMKLFRLLTKQCALVMENMLLYEDLKEKNTILEKANTEIKLLSEIDPLTGCYNRGYLTKRFPHEIKRALRYQHPLSLILCDIDFFKKINDMYGHQSGDKVLQEFVQCILDLIRTNVDWLVRYGGEEFLIVIPETPYEDTLITAERLRYQISQRIVNTEEERIYITASFGVTGFGPDITHDKISPDLMIKIADQFLYRAKEEGRNRIAGSPYV